MALRLLAGALFILLLPTIALAQGNQKNVLIFYADDTNGPAGLLINNAIRTTLKEQFKSPLQIYDEGLDSFRIPTEKYESDMLRLLQKKYDGVRLDVIFTLGAPALRFLVKYRSELFSGAPIVYIVNDASRLADLNLGSGVTGVSSKIEVGSTLRLALGLHPETQRVVVVGGTAQIDQDLMALARREFQSYESRLDFSYLSDLTPEDVRQRLTTLPDKTIVILLSFNRDAAGNAHQSPNVAALLASSSRAPIYAQSQVLLGSGIVGGRLMSYEGMGLSAAQLGLRILRGESLQSIAPQTDPTVDMFDWRQLKRWGIDEGELPAGSIVRFREYSAWELYKWRIVGAIALIFFQALLIVGLLLNRANRRRAEEEVRLSEARFRNMADTSPVMIWISDTNMLCTYFNQKCLDYTGRSMEELLGQGWLDSVHEEDAQRCIDIYTAAYARRESIVYEFRLRRADGEYRWVYSSGVPRFASNRDLIGYIGSAVDIHDRRAAEQALQIAHEEVSKLKNQLEAENIYLQEEIRLTHNVDEIVGESNAIKYVLFKIEQVAQTDTSVLVLGETGTGKELVARAIHSQSTRKDRPLVKVNCAALSASLIESELFGHEKGAFTGASARKIGRFELADGATIFLDEIGELPLELQSKLLRVIQEGELERLGSAKTIKVDLRLIAATNRNLKDEVENGNFREDLWYRLNVFPITLPPLRQRKEDIPLMVEHFASVFSKKVGKNITSISSSTMKKFQEYSWPGNVRELSNVVERALVTASGTTLHVADQFEQPKETHELIQTLEEIERDHITRILEQTAWRVEGPSGAARILGLNPSTLRTRMGKLGIQKSIRSFAQTSKQQN